MPDTGHGFLAIWNDTLGDHDAEWLRWHTREHMAERVGVPGFLAGRRYLDAARREHRYFTLYEGEAVTSFSAPPYLARLNSPTPWTRATAGYFCNFLRGACRVVATAGFGTGGVMGTLRLGLGGRGPGDADAALMARLTADLVIRDGIIRARIGVADDAVSGVQTAERTLRPVETKGALEGVLLVDGLDRVAVGAALEAAAQAIGVAAIGLRADVAGVYDLSLTLSKGDLTA